MTGVSDAVTGSMCWCPITGLDTGDAAYEWNMGVTRTSLSDEEQKISDSLAESYAHFINKLGLTDGNGNVLTLESSEEGIYQAGSYYDYLLSVVENSLNNFLADNSFPYTVASGNGGPGGGNGAPDGNGGPGGGNGAPDGNGKPEGGNTGEVDFTQIDDIDRSSAETAAVTLSGTYNSAEDYIAALNEAFDHDWVKYDAASNTVKITSMADFVKAMKVASKGMAAFDQLDAGQGENTLFGYGDGNGAHFDSTLADILKDTEYEEAYAEDMAKTDDYGSDLTTRINMYTPLYYLLESYDGYQTSNVAKFWRIRTGISQGDTALSTEVNLALAADSYSDDTEVDFETVWAEGHTMAERTGDSTSNFIEWVNECMSKM